MKEKNEWKDTALIFLVIYLVSSYSSRWVDGKDAKTWHNLYLDQQAKQSSISSKYLTLTNCINDKANQWSMPFSKYSYDKILSDDGFYQETLGSSGWVYSGIFTNRITSPTEELRNCITVY